MKMSLTLWSSRAGTILYSKQQMAIIPQKLVVGVTFLFLCTLPDGGIFIPRFVKIPRLVSDLLKGHEGWGA